MENNEQKDLFLKWFKWAVGISLFLFVLYVVLHIYIKGHEIRKLSAEQLSTLNNLITSINKDTNKDDKVKKDEIRNFLKSNILPDFNETPLNTKTNSPADSTKADTTKTEPKPEVKTESDTKGKNSKDEQKIDNFIDAHSLNSILILLPTTTFDVPSFFWMKGSKVYLELLFWIWFGVISNILYRAVNEYKKDCFYGKLIYAHIAKFIYAPFVGIVLYQCSDLLASQKLIALDKISNGAIVFVFILGFFSGRAVELLNKIKDVIIPSDDSDDEDIENDLKFEVRGIVKNDSGQTLDITTSEVKLKNTRKPSVELSSKPDSNGNFKFQNVPKGSYQISAGLIKDGSTLSASKDISIDKTQKSPITNIELSLK